MFEKMKDMMGQFQVMQKLMQDDNFKAFISHPKVQALFKDEDFKEVAKTKDFAKIMSHPKVVELTRDPEVGALMAKLNPGDFMKRG